MRSERAGVIGRLIANAVRTPHMGNPRSKQYGIPDM